MDHHAVHDGFSGFLFSPGKSIFLFAPVIIPAFDSLAETWRSNRSMGDIGRLTSTQFYFAVFQVCQWEGGYGTVRAYFVPSLTFSPLPSFRHSRANP